MKYNIERLFEEYQIRKENTKSLIDQVKYNIYRATTRDNIKIHYIFDRLKEFDSFLSKIKRKKLIDPFNEIHDLIGFRIICLFLEDITKIGDLLSKEFEVFFIENKIEEASHDVFGYMASHYKARLKDKDKDKDKIVDLAKNYSFEIQIRTIAQDAWASISHHLFYKHDISLPANLKRDFHALSGLFYIADTHFSLLQDEQQKYFVKELQELDDGTTGD